MLELIGSLLTTVLLLLLLLSSLSPLQLLALCRIFPM